MITSSETATRATAASTGGACYVCVAVLPCIASGCTLSSLGILWVSGRRINIKTGVCFGGSERENELYTHTVSRCVRGGDLHIQLTGPQRYREAARSHRRDTEGTTQANNYLTLLSRTKIVPPYSSGEPTHCVNLICLIICQLFWCCRNEQHRGLSDLEM